MTLKRSLLLAVVGLTAAGLLVVSGTAVLALRAYLLARTDDQLISAAKLAQARTALLTLDPEARGETLRQVASVTEYVIKIRGADGGTVRIVGGTPLPPGPLLDQARLDETWPQTRAVVVRGGGLTVLVALALQPLRETVARLVVVAAVASAVVFALLTLLARLVLVRRLRPLDEIAAAATDLAGGHLDRRVPAPPASKLAGSPRPSTGC